MPAVPRTSNKLCIQIEEVLNQKNIKIKIIGRAIIVGKKDSRNTSPPKKAIRAKNALKIIFFPLENFEIKRIKIMTPKKEIKKLGRENSEGETCLIFSPLLIKLTITL